MTEGAHHDTWRLSPATVSRLGAWFAFPLGGLLWMLTRNNRAWFVDDEWGMLDRANAGSWLHNMFVGYGGHLYALPHLVYWIQLNWVGVESHRFLYVVFCVSLVALQISGAAVLWRLGVPTVVALLAGTMIAYFGPGAQTMTFTAEFGANLALAFCFIAAFIALRDNIERGTVIATSALLVAAIATDSGIGSCGVVFVMTMVLLTWPRRLAVLALSPPVAAILAWNLVDHSGRDIATPAPWDRSLTFTVNLIGRAAGGLVGGAQLAGWVCLPLALVIVGVALARMHLPREVVACFVGGLIAAAVAVAGIVGTRAGYATTDELVASRFVQQVAVFLLIAFAPVIGATVRQAAPRQARPTAAVAAAGLIAVFGLNLSSLWPARQFWEAWGANTESSVRRSVTVLTVGCGSGRKPDARGLPVEAEGSDPYQHLPVHFLQDLLDQGALTPDFGIRPTRAVRDAICPPTRSEVASRGCDLTPARWREIHRQHRADRLSIDEIARRQSLSRATVRAALNSNAQTCADEASRARKRTERLTS